MMTLDSQTSVPKSSVQLIAFDFDGVICDGLLEYFQTAWQAYCEVFQSAEGESPQEPPQGLAEKFYPLRPVVETGWEMPVLIQALVQGAEADQILAGWPAIALPYLEAAGVTKAQSVRALDGVRDRQIKSDLQSWLKLHRFYPGILEKLDELLKGDIPVYIISTKEGRFIQALLSQSGVTFPAERIIGKEAKQPKYETLRQLKNQHQAANIWFVEDRLPALKAVTQQNDLTETQLFLADWGYNLAPDREIARQDSRIHLLSLDQVVQKFDQWFDK